MTELNYKDLGQWGKSIGNISLYNGMYLELTDETWNNKKLRKFVLKIIDNHMRQLTEEKKEKRE